MLDQDCLKTNDITDIAHHDEHASSMKWVFYSILRAGEERVYTSGRNRHMHRELFYWWMEIYSSDIAEEVSVTYAVDMANQSVKRMVCLLDKTYAVPSYDIVRVFGLRHDLL